jgi:hypothetical protein
LGGKLSHQLSPAYGTLVLTCAGSARAEAATATAVAGSATAEAATAMAVAGSATGAAGSRRGYYQPARCKTGQG